MINRRDILKYAAACSGVAIGMPLAGIMLSGCNPEDMKTKVGDGLAFFSDGEFEMMIKIMDVILPKTDSPAASEVGVPAIMDGMLGKVYPTAAASAFKESFAQMSQFLDKRDNLPEAVLSIEQSANAEASKHKATYSRIKQQTIAYYLSTEEIGKNFLNYLPVPGPYESCISLEEAGGKAWAI